MKRLMILFVMLALCGCANKDTGKEKWDCDYFTYNGTPHSLCTRYLDEDKKCEEIKYDDDKPDIMCGAGEP